VVHVGCFVLAALLPLAGPAFSVLFVQSAAATEGNTGTSGPRDASSAVGGDLPWQTDYTQAAEAAARQKRLLVVLFLPGRADEVHRRFESAVLSDPVVRERLRREVLVRVTGDAKVEDQGKPMRLLEHPAFAGLRGRGGLAVVDLAHSEPERYAQVVGAIPVRRWALYAPRQVVTLLDEAGRWAPATAGGASASATPASHTVEVPGPAAEIPWLTDYRQAVDVATREKKTLLVLFQQPGKCPLRERFEAEALKNPEVEDKLANVVRVRLALDAKVTIDGKEEVELLKHGALAEMGGQPGLAMIDYAHDDPRLHGQIVSVFPFLGDRVYTAEQLAVIFDLPPGTLTQRTLIYAVSTHPDRPASTRARFDVYLAEEAESHSQYQAQIGLQGHHAWETRFHRINARLGNGLTATEVCAESWPGEGLLQAAIECVRCWRLSSGHWGAVSSQPRAYAYDMKRGSNGVWYATGIFSR
jgi:hypothetical protein